MPTPGSDTNPGIRCQRGAGCGRGAARPRAERSNPRKMRLSAVLPFVFGFFFSSFFGYINFLLYKKSKKKKTNRGRNRDRAVVMISYTGDQRELQTKWDLYNTEVTGTLVKLRLSHSSSQSGLSPRSRECPRPRSPAPRHPLPPVLLRGAGAGAAWERRWRVALPKGAL